MKRMLTLVFAGMMVMQLGGALIAADPASDPTTGQWEAKRVDKLTKDLNLDADQQSKISGIIKDNEAARQAEYEKLKAIKQDEDQKIKAVLTPEQVQKYDKMEAQRMEKMQKKVKKAVTK